MRVVSAAFVLQSSAILSFVRGPVESAGTAGNLRQARKLQVLCADQAAGFCDPGYTCIDKNYASSPYDDATCVELCQDQPANFCDTSAGFYCVDVLSIHAFPTYTEPTCIRPTCADWVDPNTLFYDPNNVDNGAGFWCVDDPDKGAVSTTVPWGETDNGMDCGTLAPANACGNDYTCLVDNSPDAFTSTFFGYGETRTIGCVKTSYGITEHSLEFARCACSKHDNSIYRDFDMRQCVHSVVTGKGEFSYDDSCYKCERLQAAVNRIDPNRCDTALGFDCIIDPKNTEGDCLYCGANCAIHAQFCDQIGFSCVDGAPQLSACQPSPPAQPVQFGSLADLAVCNPDMDLTGGISMDPHIQKWDGEWFDYNGECDLVLLSAPAIDLDIHVRTTIRNAYSFIEVAAVRLGQDILQVGGWGEYFINGVDGALKGHDVPTLNGHGITYSQVNKKKHSFAILMDTQGHNITVTTFKDFVNVHLNLPSHALVGSSGLMGDYQTGAFLARDGTTLVENVNDFGQEWQRLSSEEDLFVAPRHPQAPEKCLLPKEARKDTDTKSVLYQAAAKACEEHAHQNKDACISDVMATGDLETVESEAF